MAHLLYGFFIALIIVLAMMGEWTGVGICVVILLLAKYNRGNHQDNDADVTIEFGDGGDAD